VELGTEHFQADAMIAEEPERTRLYDQMVEIMPGFAEYRRKTTRQIPVIVLTLRSKLPAGADSSSAKIIA